MLRSLRLRAFARLNSYLDRRRARQAAAAFGRMVQAYDDAIALARAKHRCVQPYLQAKADFVRGCLEGAVANGNAEPAPARAPQTWRGR